jgi:hypothetical protein
MYTSSDFQMYKNQEPYNQRQEFNQKKKIKTIYDDLIILRDLGQLDEAIKDYSQEERQIIMTVLKLAKLSPTLGMNDQRISFQRNPDGFVIKEGTVEVGSFKQAQLNRFSNKLDTLTYKVKEGGKIAKRVSNVWEKFMNLFDFNRITSQQIMNEVKPFHQYWSK